MNGRSEAGRHVSRRELLGLVGATAASSLAGCRTGGADGSKTVGASLVTAGLTVPLGVEFPPGRSEPVHVVDQTGAISVARAGESRTDSFLDVTDRMVDLSGYEERGLLGMAFHPEYPDDDRVFVRYSAPLRDRMPAAYSHTFLLSSFRVPDGQQADPDTEQVILEIAQPQSNHNAGSVVFGPDGYLYVGVGDGGGGNDAGPGHGSDWYDRNAGGNGQNTATLPGSILRLDVDSGTGDRGYGIPDDNPLVGAGGRDELYAWGFRNPWRMSFTDGQLYVADVGQELYEEVDLVERGGNYGWNVREGTHCFSTDEPSSPPETCPSETPDGTPLRDPIIEYPHEGAEVSGISVIGGYRYTGGALSALSGGYVFGDWQSQGRLFVARPHDQQGAATTASGTWPVETVDVVAAGGQRPQPFLLAFGRDAEGRLYVGTTGNQTPAGDSGRVHRLVPPQ